MTIAGPGGPGAVDRWLRELRRAVLWRRRLLAAGLLAGSAAFALHVLAPPPPEGVGVVVATHDVVAGAVLGADDVRRVDRPAGTVPAGALGSVAQAAGATVSTALRRGELITDVRLAGPSSLRGLPPDLVATPVRLADGDTAALLRPGDVVDVLAAGAADPGTEGSARLVASAVRVLVVPRPGRSSIGLGSGGGALVVLATSPPTAARLAAAAVTARLTVVVRAS